MTDLRIESSKKGKSVIICDGYEFCLNRRIESKHYWRCVKNVHKQCHSTLITEEVSGEHSIIKEMTEHSHSPNAAANDSLILRNNLKRSATTSFDSPTKLILNCMESMPSTSACSLPNKNALRQVVYRARKKDFPTEPASLDEIDVPAEYRMVEKEIFLARDVKYGNDNRLLLFCTKGNLKVLFNSQIWILDGTFKTCPDIFTQLYSIHALVGLDEGSKKIVPVVYCLLTDKAEESYMVLFRELLSYAAEFQYDLKPQHIITDFEISMINVIRIKFPDANHSGCFFHLAQNVWRHIQKSGLASRYGNDSTFSLKLRHIVALAYLPADEIPDAFIRLKAEVLPNEADPITDWFEQYYVLGKLKSHTKGVKLHFTRSAPLFPPQLWSIHNLNEMALPRTQNSVEAWHRRWNSLLNNNRHGVYATIRTLRKEQMVTNHAIEKAQAAVERTPPRKKGKRMAASTLQIVQNRHNMDVVTFLRSIANHIEL
ncbi:hypothetical protein ABMA27_011914 [Loxostege sticticalis]|uniref:MULE transposase domain-containing protein n=1 Tax=Loxostege sticticalis TaxID=481309 RepID=A0ABR3II11_LOXSC